MAERDRGARTQRMRHLQHAVTAADAMAEQAHDAGTHRLRRMRRAGAGEWAPRHDLHGAGAQRSEAFAHHRAMLQAERQPPHGAVARMLQLEQDAAQQQGQLLQPNVWSEIATQHGPLHQRLQQGHADGNEAHLNTVRQIDAAQTGDEAAAHWKASGVAHAAAQAASDAADAAAAEADAEESLSFRTGADLVAAAGEERRGAATSTARMRHIPLLQSLNGLQSWPTQPLLRCNMLSCCCCCKLTTLSLQPAKIS